MDRYQMVRLAQLVFALGLMFAAFSVGIAVGWFVWGRRSRSEPDPLRAVPTPEPVLPRVVNRDLFSPDAEGDQPIDVTVATFAPAELGAGSSSGAKVSP